MSEVTVVGLGAMGAEIVRALLAAGHRTTVWNRTAERARPLIEAGAQEAASIGDAVAASPTIISCIDAHASTRALLGAEGVRKLLAGRTVVELSTGLPGHARESMAFFGGHGAAYLDGKMLTGPHGIGRAHGHFIYAGAQPGYRRLEAMLKSLAGRTDHVGEEIGAACALDLAWLSGMFGLYMGVAHAARICSAEDVAVRHLDTIFGDMPRAKWLSGFIAERRLENPGAPLTMWRHALQHIQQQAADAGMAAEVPDFVASILDRAIAAGHGEHHIAAISEVIGERGRG